MHLFILISFPAPQSLIRTKLPVLAFRTCCSFCLDCYSLGPSLALPDHPYVKRPVPASCGSRTALRAS